MTDELQGITLIEREAPKDYPPAYFLSIELENFLCFKSRQTLELSNANGFPAQWTVILGDNGVGKTTLLRSLAGMELGSLKSEGIAVSNIARFDLPVAYNWKIDQGRRSFYTAEIRVKFGCGFPLKSWSELVPSQSTEYPELKQASIRKFPAVESFNDSYPNRGYEYIWEPQTLLGPKCFGYGANRKIGQTTLSEGLSIDSCASLFSDDESLINAEEWLLQADYAVARSNPNKTARLEQRLHLIQDALKKLLPDVSDIRITPVDDTNPRPVAEFLTPYGWVPLKGLSLGYKTVLAWIVDLAARLIDRYPDSKDPLAEPAVVLVDEIDLHLHPRWQRTIMSFLTERFPNTQFIVTAHSPLVVQAAKDANIVLLRREGDHVVIDNDPEIIDNWRVDQVLTSVFGLPTSHSTEIEPLVLRRRKLLAKSKLTAKDKRELAELETKIGTIPTAESPEDIRAMDIIRKAAQLLENQ
jgi:predicted ATP-binding protein involved in virulence